ncbi:MAG: HNH endonuclease [Ilumatobacter sp.]|nr:MAG: HNH endonuclease [Ilumatobacter sp.]
MNTPTLDPVTLPDSDELGTMSAHDAAVWFQHLDRQRRLIEAALVEVIDAADTAGHHLADGHRSITGWCRALGRWSGAEATARARTARLTRADTTFRRAMRAGEIGVAQCHRLGKAFANPRCGDQLPDVVPIMVDHAEKLSFDDFRTLVDRWEMLADLDGAHRDAAATHARRKASFTSVGTSGHLSASGCTSSTAAMAEILDHFTRAEWEADWAEARARHGDAANASHLRRTDAQRRFDALHRIFERAAGSPTDSGPSVTVNYLIDHHTVSAMLQSTPDTSDATAAAAPVDPRHRRCETSTGTVVPPATIIEAMWSHQIRRVVVDSASVVIDMGRRQRLFTGSARDAVMLASARCVNPGCPLPVTRCEGSHLHDWQHLGTTAPDNGAPECGHHNRLHNHGFTVRRDQHGHWHTYRPDGTELTEPPSAV